MSRHSRSPVDKSLAAARGSNEKRTAGPKGEPTVRFRVSLSLTSDDAFARRRTVPTPSLLWRSLSRLRGLLRTLLVADAPPLRCDDRFYRCSCHEGRRRRLAADDNQGERRTAQGGDEGVQGALEGRLSRSCEGATVWVDVGFHEWPPVHPASSSTAPSAAIPLQEGTSPVRAQRPRGRARLRACEDADTPVDGTEVHRGVVGHDVGREVQFAEPSDGGFPGTLYGCCRRCLLPWSSSAHADDVDDVLAPAGGVDSHSIHVRNR
jgi:hypothetical protein